MLADIAKYISSLTELSQSVTNMYTERSFDIHIYIAIVTEATNAIVFVYNNIGINHTVQFSTLLYWSYRN